MTAGANALGFGFPNDSGDKYSIFKHLFPKSLGFQHRGSQRTVYLYVTTLLFFCQVPLQGYKSMFLDLLP